ncbi:MAG: IS1634 family transposase [Gammaproteobacteria bacterium]|nr:IS1634 family transposase [Gammaproteobacteria bacterium]
MYLRTTKRRNRDGSQVAYYQLAHNYRDEKTGGPQAKIIHNFGRADQLDRNELVRLCQSIARVCGVTVHDPLPLSNDDSQNPETPSLPQGIQLYETRPLGAVWVIEALWERLGVGPVLRELEKETNSTHKYERALLAMTANRLCEPTSKLGVWDRWLRKVYLESCQDLKLAHMYEAMDLLHKYAARVEKTVFFKTAHLFNLEVDIIFYDTTTCSFSIDYADSSDSEEDDDEDDDGGLRKFGRNKDGTWTPQVIVALAVTQEGLPVRSWVFPGNTSDVDTVKQIKKDLQGWKLGRALFVADSGMNSEENRSELARACGHYVLATRTGSVAEIQTEVLTHRGHYRKLADNLWAKEIVVGDGVRRRRYVLCFNPKEAKRQERHRAEVLGEIKEKLASHKDRDATAKWAIKLMATKRWGRYLKVNEEKKVIIDQEAVRKAKKMDGKWVLITNDDSLSVDDIANGYKNLMVIERCFRTLKRTQISMVPMHHWLPQRIEAHVKICVLALLIERVAEIATDKSWPRIRQELDRVQVSEFRTDSHQFFQRNNIPKSAVDILKKLDISWPKTILDIRPHSSDL